MSEAGRIKKKRKKGEELAAASWPWRGEKAPSVLSPSRVQRNNSHFCIAGGSGLAAVRKSGLSRMTSARLTPTGGEGAEGQGASNV